MNARLKIVLGDIAIMTTILGMTDCDSSTLMQNPNYGVLQCADKCTKKSFIAFQDHRLQERVAKLESRFGKSVLDETFANLFDGVKGLQSFESELSLIQLSGGQPIINKTNFTEPPVQ